MRILVIGDIIGRPGRIIINKVLKEYIQKENIDYVIANGENLAGGKGITKDTAQEMFQNNINVLTGGNHIWANKDIFEFIENEPRIVRPANYPDGVGVPGRGSKVFTTPAGIQIGIINILGRIFLGNFDCPFLTVKKEIEKIKKLTNLIIVDFHAEATSEKIAMGWYLAGQVTAVLGTHTHIPTADECILKNHTAYITDIGMTGPYDSIIGVEKEIILTAFIKSLPVRHQIAKEGLRMCAVLLEANPSTGAATLIKRVRIDL